MSIFKLIRAFQKAKGRSPSPSELSQLKKQAMEMAQKETNIIPFKYKKGFGEEVDELIEKGDVTIGTAPKTTKKKLPIDPKFPKSYLYTKKDGTKVKMTGDKNLDYDYVDTPEGYQIVPGSEGAFYRFGEKNKELIEKGIKNRQEDKAKIIKEFELRNKENAYKSAFRKYKESVDKKPTDSQGILNIYRNLAKYPKGREIILGDITEIEKGLMFNTIGNRSREKLVNQLNKIYSESPPKNPFEEVKVSDQLEMNFDDFDPQGMAGGGLAYMLGEGDVSRTPAKIGGLMKMLQALSAKSPLQRYKDYLESVKRRSIEGDFKSLAPELGAVSAGGILVNRKMKKILEEGNEQQKERFLQEFIEELDKDPFYKKYPDMKDKAIEKYTERMFGEKRADGGRVPMMYGGDPGFAFEYGGSWADWNDNHKHMMPLMEYIGTKLPKDRMPFRNDRQGYKKGGMSRRGFLKLMGGLAALPVVGKLFKPIAKTVGKFKGTPNLVVDITKTPNMPDWYIPLVKKVINKGDDVTNEAATSQRQIVHRDILPDGDEVMVTQNIDSQTIDVSVAHPKTNYLSSSGAGNSPYTISYSKGKVIEEGKYRGQKEADTLQVEEPYSAQVGPDTSDVEIQFDFQKYDPKAEVHNTAVLETYATGKKVKPRGTGEVRDPYESYSPDLKADDYVKGGDDYAKGGLAKLLGE